MSVPPVIFLPGLNGDRRVVRPQAEAFAEAKIVEWMPPRPAESLADYARRLADEQSLPHGAIVVGVSFGGIVALELARHLEARCCVVIASARNSNGLPTSVRALRWLPSAIVRRVAGHASFARWAVGALATWRPAVPPPCRVVQVHGDRDRRFPRGTASADHVVAGAGHMVTRTHAAAVNAVLAEVIDALA